MAKLAMDDPFFFAKALQWYKRRDVQEAILADCENREVSPRFGEGFGKRPDALFYPADILSLATKRTTSFHSSEERWRDPLQLKTGCPRKELDDLRIGWDLVLDVDCPYWLFAKLTAHLFVRALQDHGIHAISVKFSGNKGFHVAVPWEAFPERVNDLETKNLFPEAPRAIAAHLLDYISSNLIAVKANTIVFDKTYKISYTKLKEATGKDAASLVANVCRTCRTPRGERTVSYQFLCTACGHTKKAEQHAEYATCDRCGGIMEPHAASKNTANCAVCNGTEFEPRFNVQALIEVDTVLLASRHLFRTSYSLHEKSGLVSVVFHPTEVMAFEKERAKPENVKQFLRFLDGSKAEKGEATELLVKALELSASRETAREVREYAIPEEAIPEELFPPCIKLIFDGIPDGKKRAMFALTNFLRSCGWGHDQLCARIEEWNKRNPEPLREVIVKGHLRYQKVKKETVLPPNCKSFYQDIGVCKPDNFCPFIKNPAQYAKRKAELAERGKPAGPKERPKLTEEQKEMRKAFRERQKAEKGAPANP